MEIQYKTKELQKCAVQPGYAQRKLGAEQAKAYLRRINVLLGANSFEDLR